MENHFCLCKNVFGYFEFGVSVSCEQMPIFKPRISYGMRSWNALLGSHPRLALSDFSQFGTAIMTYLCHVHLRLPV